MMKRLIIFFILLNAASAVSASFEFFPRQKITSNPHASLLRSSAVDVLYIYSKKDQNQYMGFNFGSKIPFLSFNTGEFAFQTGGSGGIFTRFELHSESFNFTHADFIGSFYFDASYKIFTFETLLYHVSSHLGDDYIHYDNGTHRNVGYEGIKHYTNISVSRVFQFNLGCDIVFSERPENRNASDYILLSGIRFDYLVKGMPFFAESEIEYLIDVSRVNVGVRIGFYMSYLLNTVILDGEPAEMDHHEFSVYFYYGYSKMGYFADTRELLILLGPTYRF